MKPTGETAFPTLRGAILLSAARVSIIPFETGSVMFSEDRRTLFRPDGFTEMIWPRLRTGLAASDFADMALAAGRPPDHVFAELSEAGLIEVLAVEGREVDVSNSLDVELGTTRIRFRTVGEKANAVVRGLFGHLIAEPGPCRTQIVLTFDEGRFGLSCDGGDWEWCDADEAAPAVKARATDLAIDALDGMALHVATVVKDDMAILLTGPPGAGKSTLAVALESDGFVLDGDDVAALLPDGRVRAIPFAATLKSGSWTLFADGESGEAYRREDSQTVRYRPLGRRGPPDARSVRAVICIDRSGRRGLVEMSREEGLAALIDGGWSRDDRMSTRDVLALVSCVEGASVYRASYSDLDSAISLVRTVWRSASGDD